MKFLIFIIKWHETFKNTIKVYEVSTKYIMLFMHNNRYLPLTGLLTYFVLPEKTSWNFCFTVGDSVSAFRVKLGANDLNCVDVPLNPTQLLND